MRPLRMRVAGFTAFRDEQVIDFADLELFAITGPTGSGKSSLLDAMTYVLFGKVDRVGDRVSQLISQGQPAMSVELEFSVDDAEYRVTRRTSTTGPTRILLQRRGGDEWEQHGPGADRVRDVEATVIDLLGLDYDAFTRSVLLPQGKFQQFLTGDAAERRRILSDLLGLDLYRRMSVKAGELAAGARAVGETRREMLATEFGDVSVEALERSRELAAAAIEHESRLVAASAEVERIAELARADEQRSQQLEVLRAAIGRVAERAVAAGPRIGKVAEAVRATAAAVLEAAGFAERVDQDVEAARRELDAAEEEHGRNAELAGLLALISERRTLAAQLAGVRSDHANVVAAATGLQEAERSAALDAETAEAEEDAARQALERAAAECERIAQQNTVAGLLVGAKVGDPCPICGEALRAVPRAPGTAAVARAEAARGAARQALAAAEQTTRRAAAALLTQRAAVADQTRREAELATAVGGLTTRIEASDEVLAPLVGEAGPDAAAKTIEARMERLTELTDAIGTAEATAREMHTELAARQQAETRARGALQAEQARLQELETSALSAQVIAVVPGAASPDWPSLADPVDEPDVLAAAATAIGGCCDELETVVAAELGDASKRASAHLEQALVAAGDHAGDAADFAGLRQQIATVRRTATAEAATAGVAATAMAERLERRGELEIEARAAEQRAALMRTLAQALHSDRLVAFVQAEALEALAVAATRHLDELSDGRYRLACRANDFEVIDTWNGEERRSVRTLSGGETFLASLALALALAEQVPAIGVGQRVRLDSLFLDEGFGTLDTETLDTVIAAINVLGADGRMIGVVSHVAELAESLPARLEVAKSPRGSQVTRADAPARALAG